MNKYILLILLFILTGCANVIMTKDTFNGIKLKKEQKVKTLALRTYGLHETHIDKVYTRYRMRPMIEKTVFQIVNQSDLAQQIIQLEPMNKDQTFETAKEGEEYSTTYLPLKRIKEADYYLDVFVYSKQKGYHGHGYLILPYMLWAFLHVATLGLIPVASDNSIELRAVLYDKNGKILEEDTAKNESWKWGWTPFMLRDDAKKPSDPYFQQEIASNAISEIINKIEVKK